MRPEIPAAQWDADYLWMEVNMSTIDFVLNLREQRNFGSVLQDQCIANMSQKENYRLELPLDAARGRALLIPCLILPSQEPLCF